MDADILRLILIIIGGLLVAGIYLWERHKRINARVQAVRRDHHEMRREPVMGADKPAPQATEAAAANTNGNGTELDQALHELGDLVSEKVREVPRPAARKKQGEKRARAHVNPAEAAQDDLFADDAVVDADHYHNADASIPAMILQINVVAKDDSFEGPDILRVMQGVDMHVGDMRIYHRRDGSGGNGPVLFSMASMVEPGMFPIDAMEDFKTPGLTLFAQLPGPQDGLALFSDMLFSTERIANDLGGELQDETHSRLTKQTIGHIRSQILEHRRKVQLAKSKRS